MCGIVGCLTLGEKLIDWKKDKEYLCRMLAMQKHRGPDDMGMRGFHYRHDRSIDLIEKPEINDAFQGVIGFNRLSIQDLSSNGHQPMCNEKGDIILAFNGEIYNADIYRQELLKAGYRFHSTTDTEVILNLYIDRGIEETLRVLNGMFAIIVVDMKKGRIYIARDRFGIKPMYYMVHEKNIYFSSEIKSFLAIPGYEPHIDNNALNECLIYISSPQKTLIKEIQQIEPGELMCIEGKNIKKEKFFDIDQFQHACGNVSLKEKMEELDVLLQDAVKRQMVSDVAVGCQLSGGVDSSLISFYASYNSKNKMQDSVSIIFKDAILNEEKYIDEVADDLKLHSHKYTFDGSILIENMKRAVWHLESIPTVPNANALMLLTKKAKENVTVLLSGEGADEIFGGYSDFNRVKIMELDAKYNMGQHQCIDREWNLIRKPKDILDFAILCQIYVSPERCAKLLNIETDDSPLHRRREEISKFSGSNIDKLTKYEMNTYLADLLIRQDKMSMANSIENRVPFLDNEVVDFAFSLPENLIVGINQYDYDTKKTKGFELITGKYILKELCAEKYGRQFGYRGKGGFGLPMRYFMGLPEFKNIYDEIIDAMKKRGQLNTEYVCWLYDRLPVLDWSEIELLWRALNIEIFMEEFIDKRGVGLCY